MDILRYIKHKKARECRHNQAFTGVWGLFHKSGLHPRELLLTAMAQFKTDGKTTFSTEEIMQNKPTRVKAFVLTVDLPCGDGSIWRKLVVPATETFEKLHRMIQVSFNWQNGHLHQFQIIAGDGNIVAQSKSYDMDAFDDC